MTAQLLRLMRRYPGGLVRLAVVGAGFALARSDSGVILRAVGVMAAGIAAFGGARRAEAVLRKTEERLRTDRPRRFP